MLDIRYVGHCWKSKDELTNYVFLWAPSHRRASVGQPKRTYLHQLCTDTGCCLGDLPRAMDDGDERERERESERVREIRTSSVT